MLMPKYAQPGRPHMPTLADFKLRQAEAFGQAQTALGRPNDHKDMNQEVAAHLRTLADLEEEFSTAFEAATAGG
jgi:hypothetical protein